MRSGVTVINYKRLSEPQSVEPGNGETGERSESGVKRVK